MQANPEKDKQPESDTSLLDIVFPRNDEDILAEQVYDRLVLQAEKSHTTLTRSILNREISKLKSDCGQSF